MIVRDVRSSRSKQPSDPFIIIFFPSSDRDPWRIVYFSTYFIITRSNEKKSPKNPVTEDARLNPNEKDLRGE